MNRRHILASAVSAAATLVPARLLGASHAEAFAVTRTDAEWKRQLDDIQFRILRGQGTERPGSSPLNGEKRKGRYSCAGCDLPLFSSETKFESGTGWPSFWAPISGAVGTREDRSHGMSRTEVHCRRCGGHLGHLFTDGPEPTGHRYCMNGAALRFTPA